MFLAERTDMINTQTISPTMKKPNRLVIRLMLQTKEAGCIHSLSGGGIVQTRHAVYWPNGPFGHHISYHDAEAGKPTGRINQKLHPKRGGIFQTLPEGKVLGHEAHHWDAPAFSGIADVQAFPPQDMVLIKKRVLLSSLEAMKLGSPSEADHDFVLSLPEQATGLLGPTLLLVRPGAEAALEKWCKRQVGIWDGEGAVRLDVSVFTTFQPWLALVAGSIAEREQHG